MHGVRGLLSKFVKGFGAIFRDFVRSIACHDRHHPLQGRNVYNRHKLKYIYISLTILSTERHQTSDSYTNYTCDTRGSCMLLICSAHKYSKWTQQFTCTQENTISNYKCVLNFCEYIIFITSNTHNQLKAAF